MRYAHTESGGDFSGDELDKKAVVSTIEITARCDVILERTPNKEIKRQLSRNPRQLKFFKKKFDFRRGSTIY